MRSTIILFILNVWFCSLLNAQTDTLIHRTEYESVGDLIHDVDDPNEGAVSYSILSGNTDGYYAINPSNGQITVAIEIQDVYNLVHADTLSIDAGGTIYSVIIVDGYDYFINNLSSEYTVLSEHLDAYVDANSEWTAFNNLWGKGSAVPNVDFRIATVHKESLPDTTFLVWDTPSSASAFGGSSVWCYNNVFWGNRPNLRSDLPNFPFQIAPLNSLDLEFDFEKLFGDESFKISMNMFMTDESYLTSFSSNDGDFFFVFDQVGTWIPNYPYSLPDTTILGKPFALRYNDLNNGNFYERRRVIIKDHEKLMSGTLDVKNLFDRFVDVGYLNALQYIYHIQLGIEVTSGYGAVRFNEYNFTANSTITGLTNSEPHPINIYPNPVTDVLTIQGNIEDLRIYDSFGRLVNLEHRNGQVNLSTLPSGIYYVRTEAGVEKIHKL